MRISDWSSDVCSSDLEGRKVAEGVYAMIVPGSGLVKEQAEAEGLDRIFTEAGFDWREPGCSMCLAMNADRLEPGERCASTSNRNFEGRQGRGGRTHLVSRSEEHTSELPSLMRISYAVFCLKKQNYTYIST